MAKDQEAPKGWGCTEDIRRPCDDCGCYGGHLPSCSHFEDAWTHGDDK